MENQTAEVLVLGAGPGGYTAAFRAADLGQKVVLVDSGPVLGGVLSNQASGVRPPGKIRSMTSAPCTITRRICIRWIGPLQETAG